jgi:4-hydroxybenzoyl-CoA thioesterase
MAVFSRDNAVHFSDTDPAGILFYPRYFEMTSALIEDWFAEELDHPFNTLHQGTAYGVPTLSLDISFSAASRIADVLRMTLGVARLGKTSFTLDISAACGDEPRFKMRQVMVYAALGEELKSTPLPTELRTQMARFLTPELTD